MDASNSGRFWSSPSLSNICNAALDAGQSVQYESSALSSAAYRPRIAIKAIDSKRALKGFRPPHEKDLGTRETARRIGHSLRAVSAALTGRSAPRSGAVSIYMRVAVEHATAVITASCAHGVGSDEGRLRQARLLLTSNRATIPGS